jgi:hypothetical protein
VLPPACPQTKEKKQIKGNETEIPMKRKTAKRLKESKRNANLGVRGVGGWIVS